jgi:hypothetical protein
MSFARGERAQRGRFSSLAPNAPFPAGAKTVVEGEQPRLDFGQMHCYRPERCIRADA